LLIFCQRCVWEHGLNQKREAGKGKAFRQLTERG
jgi:hypothetical protein